MNFQAPLPQQNSQEMMAFNLELTQRMMDSCLRALKPGSRRFGTAVDH